MPDARAAAERAVALVREGRAEVLMKGSLHTDELLSAVVSREKGLRTGRRISHAFLMDVPTYHKVLVVTDAAINIAPTLEDKVDICQNAIDLARSLGVKQPKVAVLAAVETVNSKMPATLDAAALCKMADRGQIKGGLVDGPLAFDNAISKEAATTKGIRSEVAGDPDILLAPDLEAGNILAKQLSFLANADSAGLVLGARVPIVLTSRADSVRSRIASCAVAAQVAHARRAAREGVVMDPFALVLNAGSSSLKFCLFQQPKGAAWRVEARGQIEGIGTAPGSPSRTARAARRSTRSSTPRSATARPPSTPSPAGSGPPTRAGASPGSGTGWSTAARGSASRRWSRREILAELAALTPLAPLHQPHNLAPIEAIFDRMPDVPQVAVSTPGSTAATPRSPPWCRCPASCARAGSSGTGSTASPTSTSPRSCRTSPPTSPTAG